MRWGRVGSNLTSAIDVVVWIARLRSLERSDMDFNERLDELEKKVQQAKASAEAAARENHKQLQQRIEQATTEIDSVAAEAKRDATIAAQRTSDQWQQRRAEAQKRAAELKAKAQRRLDQADTAFAVADADTARSDAFDAIDFADWAVENARLAILDAIDARVYADERQAALV
jgi:hypothetical protein